MTKTVTDRLGKGLSPQAFIDSMTKNQEKFLELQSKFEWKSDEDREFFESLSNRDDLRCLIIAADWCGDVIRNVPVVFRALENSGMPVEVFIQEQHMDLMDQYLTMGGRAIPIVIFADTGGFVLGHWGPRPAYVQEPMKQFKLANTDRDAPGYEEKLMEARKAVVARYGEDTAYQQLIVTELRELLSSF